MFSLPPIPAWNAAHPILVHFPIALLLITPALVLLALIFRPQAKGLSLAALAVMGFGVLGAVLAAASGEEAAEAMTLSPAAKAVLEQHEDLGEMARNIFAGLWGVLAVVTLITFRAAGSEGKRVAVVGSLLFLLLSAAGSLVLVNAGHQGGRLVHEFGVHAGTSASASNAASSPVRKHGDDD